MTDTNERQQPVAGNMTDHQEIVPLSAIQASILQIRGQRVILDADLARLYAVSTARLNQQVSRNRDRFPGDFVFQLSSQEKEDVANCNILSKLRYHKGLPFAFTEHGALMAASVLKTEQAARVSVLVVRAFVKLREMVGCDAELAKKIDEARSAAGHA